MEISKSVREILLKAYNEATKNNDEFITPEHLLYCALDNEKFRKAILNCNGKIDELKSNLRNYIDEHINRLDTDEPEESFGVKNILLIATEQAIYSERNSVELEHIIAAFYSLKNNYGTYFLEEQGITKRDLLFYLSHEDVEKRSLKSNIFVIKGDSDKENKENVSLSSYSKNLINEVKNNEIDTLIGREDIIERTIQILCRRTKNNPIHIGEPGVGKTAITLGLAKKIADGSVPEKLKNAEIFSLDLGAILAGTKYRGDFEERIKVILDEIANKENPIVYIDEIHNIVGSGALNGGALDGAGLIKGYLLEGKIRFIGATTFDDYKKYFEKDKALVRRFQTIEVKETSILETIKIIEGIINNFEEFHNVKYTKEAIETAVKLSYKYINDRFMPDKAIDIIDEAGSYISVWKGEEDKRIVDGRVIEDIISKVCNIPKQTVEKNEVDSLKELENNLKDNIFGQDEGIEEVSRCIKMSRAGLNDENKPIASMLFVGPTGVGKTEVAKILSKTLGVELIRFDMSEYSEKHAASKLIGSPPGYVGYEEGGLLTDTIRKKPNSVLLLDEIEKAHNDILNVLLQVMDYATLTDNKGRKADFRNVIIIMTSNAGARNIGKSIVGFGRDEIKSEAITEEVKKIFTPEFRNRLDKIVVFNNIDKEMAKSIVEKEINKFKEKLANKNIEIMFTDRAIELIVNKGISKEFGAREIIRVINSEIKPLLVDEILFGRLNNGGKCNIDINKDKYILEIL
ncbi:ATP-dependent Clp protease ATP-binding subunit ClpA [Clostridium carnis]